MLGAYIVKHIVKPVLHIDDVRIRIKLSDILLHLHFPLTFSIIYLRELGVSCHHFLTNHISCGQLRNTTKHAVFIAVILFRRIKYRRILRHIFRKNAGQEFRPTFRHFIPVGNIHTRLMLFRFRFAQKRLVKFLLQRYERLDIRILKSEILLQIIIDDRFCSHAVHIVKIIGYKVSCGLQILYDRILNLLLTQNNTDSVYCEGLKTQCRRGFAFTFSIF